MKRNFLLITISLLVCFCTVLKAQDEDAELTKIVFSPDPAYVDIDGQTELCPLFITFKDTVKIRPDLIETWLADGNPDPVHIYSAGNSFYYSPKGKMPEANPVTVSAVLKRSDGETKFTVVTHVYVTESQSQFTLSRQNGTTEHYSIESKMFATGGINAGTTMGFYSKSQNLTACSLTDIKTGIGVSISFIGNSTGVFNFSKTDAIGISMGSFSCGSGDMNGNPTEGTIEVVRYDGPGGSIKVNVNGIVFDANNISYRLTGTFYVTRNNDVN